MKETQKKAALVYAKMGWTVLPLHSVRGGRCTCGKKDCPSPGKHPLISNGVQGASKTPEAIIKWFAKWPWANIGIATGKKSGFFVVDVDGASGEESLKEQEEINGKLPPTVEQITGGGGRHILFEQPEEYEILNKVNLFEGVDIRGDGGYIVVPPSVHVSGRKYIWEVSSRPLEVEMAVSPPWLLYNVRYQTSTEKTNWPHLITQIPEGQRNQTLARYAGRLIGRGISGRETLIIALSLNSYRCSPPLPEDEVKRIVDSICQAEIRKIGGLEDGR